KQNKQQERKTALLDSESGHFDYGIEEQLDRKTSTEQIVIDVETIKVNLSKTPIELDGYEIQNESEEGDSTPKGNNTYFEEIKPIKNPFVGLKRKAKIEIESDEIYPKTASPQKVPQINVLLQEILKRLETVEDNQSVLLVTDKVNPSTRSLAHSCS
ncbi:28021_t:CDS:2, partial [Gigaspora margarita]